MIAILFTLKNFRVTILTLWISYLHPRENLNTGITLKENFNSRIIYIRNFHKFHTQFLKIRIKYGKKTEWKLVLYHWFLLKVWLIKKSCNLIGWEHFVPYVRNKNFPKYGLCTGTQQKNLKIQFHKIARTDRKTDGRTDGRIERGADGRMDGRTDRPYFIGAIRATPGGPQLTQVNKLSHKIYLLLLNLLTCVHLFTIFYFTWTLSEPFYYWKHKIKLDDCTVQLNLHGKSSCHKYWVKIKYGEATYTVFLYQKRKYIE